MRIEYRELRIVDNKAPASKKRELQKRESIPMKKIPADSLRLSFLFFLGRNEVDDGDNFIRGYDSSRKYVNT